MLLVTSGAMFGYAKPVPITPENFKNYRRDVALVAIAGPLSNLLMACFWIVFLKIIISIYTASGTQQAASINIIYFAEMARIGVQINLVLMILNLIPLPPLDGSRVLSSFLHRRLAYQYSRIEPYGFLILFALFFTGILWKIMLPLLILSMQLLSSIFSVNLL